MNIQHRLLPVRVRVAALLVAVLFSFNHLYAQATNLDWKMHNVGKVRQVIVNTGALSAIDANGVSKHGYPGLVNCEFPPNSNEEHIYLGGLWIGATTPNGDTLMSVTKTHFTPDEFYPTDAEYDTIWVVSKGDTVDIPYWENYTALADQDFVCRYNDYHILNIDYHEPLFLDVIQTSHAWSSPPLDEFIVFQYDIIPTRFDLQDVYIAYWQQGEVGDNAAAANWFDDLTFFYPEYQMGVTADNKAGDDGDAFSPIGIKVMDPADTSLTWTYKHQTHEELSVIARDPKRYAYITDGDLMQNLEEPQRSHWCIAFGPIEQVRVGETLHVELAAVFGDGIDGLLDNAQYLEFLAERDYKVPSPPPMPVLKVVTQSHEVNLNWRPEEGETNPEEYTDPYRGDGETKPFEGYRLYKSTYSPTGPWTLLGEYDLPNNDFGYNSGLEHEYIDRGLLDNLEYYYSVSAFSKPDDATEFPSLESSINANAKVTVPGTPSPETVGQVCVVPNPYRGDVDYNAYNPKWEKNPPGRTWMEQDRRIQFINLPNQCEIRIYTLAGDLVNTLWHDDPERGYMDWNLTSQVGQAISSGIYLFSVRGNHNGKVQVGKFVIIK
ncbi:MAG: hypothetical protein KAU50_02565 [Candidatus Marinimicrobia bacterium]|nr:hypothetical protein [Candidatus Neomarinimicrobiota bacterium]